MKNEIPIIAAIWYCSLPKEEWNFTGDVDYGLVVTGFRHGNIISMMSKLTGKRSPELGEHIQGFLTNKNRFVDREEAMNLMLENTDKIDFINKRELFSEDLY